jgi:arginase
LGGYTAVDNRRIIGERLALIGVPTSAGAFASGQEQAPAALREVGLIELLREAGVDVNDRGDREAWRLRPDRVNPRAQNLAKVIEIVTKTARRVTAAVGEEEAMLVLGGDCTVGVGTVAGHVSTGERVGLLYFDLHADLNVPDTVARVRSIGWAWRKCWASREPRASWSRSGRVRRC